MKLRGIEFGNVLGAAGVQGFFGEGYWYHRWLKLFGLLNFIGMTFVSKTTTLYARAGNMPLRSDYTPQEWFPDCVRINFRRAMMLNAVSLSGPGLGPLIKSERWQTRDSPFLISIMSIAKSPQQRLEELRQMIILLQFMKERCRAKFGVQINFSCPNTAHDPRTLLAEVNPALEMAGVLDVPLMPKFSIASADIMTVAQLEQNPNCDAICVSNTVPFGWSALDWTSVWGSDVSPLAKFGGTGGGLSGEPLRRFTCAWIQDVRAAGFTKPINGGGGILAPEHITEYHNAGVSSVFLGSIASLRPWNVARCIRAATELIWR